MKRYFILLGLFFAYLPVVGQSDKAKAMVKGREAVKLMDKGEFKESISLLKEAQKLDPDNIDYPYELAYAEYMMEDFSDAIKLLEKLLVHPGVNDRVFQLLGNSYDMMGNPTKAIQAYDDGLKTFPRSGILNLERGNMELLGKRYVEALGFYEKGIEVDPNFPSNYYRATQVYLASTEKVWAMLYGEIFLVLDRNSERAKEVSKLLMDTYRSQIKIEGDTGISVSFSKISVVTPNGEGLDHLPFGLGVYEPNLGMAVFTSGVKTLDLEGVHKIREKFVENFFSNDSNKEHTNVLFEFHKKIKDAGHFEAYDYWLFGKSDEAAFRQWLVTHKVQYDAFVKWMGKNSLVLTDEHKFYVGQYK